ncbi:hypothetical protein [Paraclostridium bifermentans]|uniref:hypothetical protein n=1 Tax=Paraclostridium bifermentans TaxID=1490 RepID=UPI0025B04712|nr:hypothetical protein [Paraclostridium bifermentans]
MKEKPYNLQVPIDRNLELALKQLAEEDDRTLRAYCRRILQDHVKNLGKEVNSSTQINHIVKKEKNSDVITEESLQLNKSKVKGF